MDKFQIETAQNIQLSQKTANLGDRIFAFLIDMLIIIVYELILYYIFNTIKLGDMMNQWAIAAIFGLPPFLYHLLMETFNNGQSVGKAALRIRVVRLDGLPATFSNYLTRWLLRFVDFTISSGAVAIFTFLLNEKGQRLGDLAANTTVITEKRRIGIDETLSVDIAEDYSPKYTQVTVFSDHDIEQIKNIFYKAKREKQWSIVGSLAKKTASVMDITPDESNNAEFLKRVIQDYNYYTQL